MANEKKIDIVADHILTQFNKWSDDRSEKQATWMRSSRIARLQPDNSDKTVGRSSENSQIKMPTTKNALTIARDNIYQMLFDADQFFDIKGRTPDDSPDTLKFYLQYLLQQDKTESKFKPFLWDLIAYGTGICQVNVSTVTEKRLTQKSKTEDNVIKRFTDRFFSLSSNQSPNQSVKLEKNVRIRPSFEWINIFNFYIESQALNIQDATGVIIRKQQKFHTLSQMQDDGVLSGIERLFSNLTRDTQDKDVQTGDIDADRRERLRKSGLIADLGDGDVSLLEYWGWLDKDLLEEAGYDGEINNGGAEVVCLVGNGNTVLKLEPNPHITGDRPFYKETFEEVNGEFYGIGVCEIADGPQRALDATVRSRIDNKRIAINQIFGVDINRIVADKDGNMFPGKTFFTEGDPNQIIKQLTISDVTNGSYIEAQEFERAIYEATGISPVSGGLNSPKSQTATEVAIQRNQASIRLRQIALDIERNILEPVLRKFYQISLQFFNGDEIVKATGATPEKVEDLRRITIGEIVGDYDFIPQGVAEMSAKGEFTKIMDFLTRTANQFDIQATNRPLLLKKAYRSLGFNDADTVFQRDSKVGLEMLDRASGSKGVGSPPSSPQEGGLSLIGNEASEQGSAGS